jgi:hypothetical protein
VIGSPEALALAGALALPGAPESAVLQSGDPLDEVIARRDPIAAMVRARERVAAAESANGDPRAFAARLEELADKIGALPGPEAAAFVEEQLVRALDLREQVDGRGRVDHLPTLEKLSEVAGGSLDQPD